MYIPGGTPRQLHPDSNNRRHRLRARQAVRECAKVYLERLCGHSYKDTHTSCDDADDSHLVFVTLAILSNIADAVTMIACSFLAPPFFFSIQSFHVILCVGEPAEFQLLLLQLFSVSKAMKIAIWAGIACTFVIYTSSLAVNSYFAALYLAKTWDQLIAEALGSTLFPLYWAVGQGAASTLLDVYILILPLPTIYPLNLCRREKIQVAAVFLVALSALVASATSLVYRVKSIQDENPDLMYDAGVRLILCVNLAEMEASLIICSAPAFARFMRVHVLETRVLKALQSSWGGGRSSGSRSDMANRKQDPNQPRTGREKRPNYKGRNYMEMGDMWLLNSGARADVEAVKQDPIASNGDADGMRMVKTFDVQHAPLTSFK
ncbi:hypothetical protein X797_011350 [Metarhizium robertsii]|uniref:Rhodopsin domain-containing protein n=1 Tax=Metarhizium robertsii TaxID=568076 RepID=A0A0A1UMV2_9HYPO|nr:hypothetical protein X797_011350 [Metarhizium robertsii]